MMPELKKYAWLGCLIPLFLLAVVLYKNNINIPTGDDVYVMDMFNQLQTASNRQEQWAVIFSQHNEHRLVVTRLLALLQYALSGSIDLRWWIVFGNLSLVMMVVLFYRHLGQRKEWILPIAFVLICPASNTLIAMQNSNLFSALFGIATLHFSLKTPASKNSFFTFLCSGLSIFSNSGGFALLALVSVVWFFQKRYYLLALWLVWAVFLVASYYWNYENIYRHPTSGLFFEQLPKAAQFFLAFSGSLSFNPVLAQVTGLLFLLLSLFALYRGYYLQRPFIFLCMAYSLMMAAMTTFKRYEYGLNTALSERYCIYSMILGAAMIVMLSDVVKRPPLLQRVLYPVFLLLTALLNLKYVTFHLRHPQERKEALLTKMENFHRYNSGFNCMEVHSLKKLVANGFYDYPLTQTLHPKHYYDLLNTPPIRRIKLRVDTVFQTRKNLYLKATLAESPAQVEKINRVPHKYLVIHDDTTPFEGAHNELTQPRNHKTLILDVELENDRHKVRLPQLCIEVPKKHFVGKKYAVYFLFMDDNPVNHPPVKSNVSFSL